MGIEKGKKQKLYPVYLKVLLILPENFKSEKTTGNIMTAEYSIIVNKARNTITILDIPLAFALLPKT